MHGDGIHDSEDPASNRSKAALVFLLTGALLTTATPTIASTGNQQDCEAHQPIRILEDKGDNGFVWDDPVTGEEVHRPGSGVVAGDGTASDPYVIEGWCISGASWDPGAIATGSCTFSSDGPNPESTGILVCGTTQHFELSNTTVNLWEHGTGIGNVSADTGTVAHTSHRNNTYQLHLEDAPGLSIMHNVIHGLDDTGELWHSLRSISGTSDDVAIVDNRLVVAEKLVTLDGDDLLIADNHLDSGSEAHIDTAGDGLAIVDNTAVSQHFATPARWAIRVAGTDALVEGNTVDGYDWAGVDVHGTGAEVGNNTITDGARGVWLDGSDHRVHNTTIQDSGVGVYADPHLDGALVENVTTTNTSTGFKAVDSNDTTWRYNEATGYTNAGMRVDGAENVTVRKTNFADTNGTALEVQNTETTVDARYNWWGCPDGPDDAGCDDVVGDAVYDEWLTSPVGNAGEG